MNLDDFWVIYDQHKNKKFNFGYKEVNIYSGSFNKTTQFIQDFSKFFTIFFDDNNTEFDQRKFLSVLQEKIRIAYEFKWNNWGQ